MLISLFSLISLFPTKHTILQRKHHPFFFLASFMVETEEVQDAVDKKKTNLFGNRLANALRLTPCLRNRDDNLAIKEHAGANVRERKDVGGRVHAPVFEVQRPEERVAGLVSRHHLSPEVARQLVADGLDGEADRLVAAGAEPALAARILLQILPTLARGEAVLARVPELMGALKAGQFAKEALEPILKALDAAPDDPLGAVLRKAGVQAADASAVDAVCRRVVAERLDFVKAKGTAAMGPLMGPVMAELRGKADGQVISARLKAAIEAALK